MLLQTTFPPDIRVENEIETLVNSGVEVHLLCKNEGNQAVFAEYQGATIHRIKSVFSQNILGKLIQFPAFFNPVWLWTIFRIIRQHHIHILHVHDLPLTFMAIIFKALFGLRIIYDMHENYPAALKVWNKRGLEAIFKNYKIARIIERRSAKGFDRFIAVIEENQRRFKADYGTAADKIFIVSNLVVLPKYQPNHIYHDFEFPPDKHVLIYTGGLDLHRGLGLTLKMFKILITQRSDVFLLIVGGGRSSAGKVEENILRADLSADPQLNASVVITGWVDFKYLPWLVQQSDVCLLPQESNPHTDTTIPHKLFQYMAMAKPVVAADAVPVKRILSETHAGVIFKSGDPIAYASAVNQVLEDEDAELYGKLGRAAVIREFNWEIAAENLKRIYTELVAPDLRKIDLGTLPHT